MTAASHLKIAVLGSGGREHALVWRLQRDGHDVLCLPGSDAIVPSRQLDIRNTTDLVACLQHEERRLVVVGPEGPLQAGVADALRAAGFAVVGPGRDGARLEWSKAYAKEFMLRHGVATARYVVGKLGDRDDILATFPVGSVVKLDGLAAGKGVVVCGDPGEARQALADLADKFGADAAVVVEERLLGREVSVIALVSDGHFALLPAAMDHKRLGEGDTGPNTGGMGAVCPVPWCAGAVLERIVADIVRPTIAGLATDALTFRGLLYFGIMQTAEGPRLLEYNTRFGDPEAQAILPLIDGDLGALLWQTATGGLADATVRVASGQAAAVVVAAPGYPESPRTDEPLTGLDEPGALIFHAGTKGGPGNWRSAGGRLVTAVGVGATQREALNRAYRVAFDIGGADLQMRRDLGTKARPARVAVLFSGRGSNMAALIDAAQDGILSGLAEFCLALSDRPAAPGLALARARGVPVQVVSGERVPRVQWSALVLSILRQHDIEWVVLAGLMRILSPELCDAYAGRILNIHPADTRLHQGLHGYEWALRQGLESTTITVHKVDSGLDSGPIVAQRAVDLRGATTLAEVERRGLPVEHLLYPAALCKVLLEEG